LLEALRPYLCNACLCLHKTSQILLRKEVIQPLVPQRLPCYDFVPVTSLTLGHRLPRTG